MELKLQTETPTPPSHAAEIKKQREFYQKLGMEVPGDIKGELCNMKTHLDQRNGTTQRTRLAPETRRTAPGRRLANDKLWNKSRMFHILWFQLEVFPGVSLSV